jgi:hypothetical protein
MRLLWSFLALTALTATALAQVDWTEQGDAGDLPETAQATGTDTSTPLRTISGTLDANDVDMFAIYIADPSAFRAETNTTTTDFDSQLWLFDVNGNGIVHDDDSAGSLRSRITNANNCIPGPGIYYIAISRWNRDPIDCDGNAIWTSASNACAVAGRSRVASWTGSTSAGTYQIVLQGAFTAPLGADPADCPPPDPWDEQFYGGGDAGDLPATAQLVTLPDQTPCQSPVTRIRGDNDADDVDMYVICITDPANFVASTVGTTGWDTQLWLFRCDGTGVVHNDDAVGTTVLQSRIDNSTNCIQQGGIYLLAISRWNRDAVDSQGQRLWNDSPFRSLRCPDGPGAANPVAGWTGTTSAGGRYVISLQGAYFVSEQGCQTCQPHNGDVDNNGCVDDADLLAVLFGFGQTGDNLGRVDVNCDQVVDDADLLQVLFSFGSGC